MIEGFFDTDDMAAALSARPGELSHMPSESQVPSACPRAPSSTDDTSPGGLAVEREETTYPSRATWLSGNEQRGLLGHVHVSACQAPCIDHSDTIVRLSAVYVANPGITLSANLGAARNVLEAFGIHLWDELETSKIGDILVARPTGPVALACIPHGKHYGYLSNHDSRV